MISHFALPTSTRHWLPEILVSGPEMIPSRGPCSCTEGAKPDEGLPGTKSRWWVATVPAALQQHHSGERIEGGRKL
jgi:hypothetical protein